MSAATARRVASVTFWALYLVAILLESFYQNTVRSGGFYLIQIFLFAGIVFAWVHFDAQVREFRLGPLMRFGIVALAILFVPIYLVRSRGWGGAVKSMGKFFGLLLILIVFVSIVFVVAGVGVNAVW